MQITKRIRSLTPSQTIAVDAKVKELTGQHIKVINIGIGEPDFATPDNIKNAAIKGINDNVTHYTETSGLLELRKAIAQKLKKENDVKYDLDEIVVGTGSKFVIYEALQVLCEKNDEVLIPLPTWTTYAEQVKLAEGKPVYIPLQPPFKLTAADTEKYITKKTKILIINSPANPTGARIDKEELEKISRLAIRHNIWILSDEIYEKLLYTNQKHYSIASFNDATRQRTITINGVSKAYAMTGWRIGYAAGPKEIIKAISALQGQLTSNASSISQVAAIEALNGPQKSVEQMRKVFASRRTYLMQELSKFPELSFTPPEGAFYFFVSIEKLLKGTKLNSQDWCQQLLAEEQVAVVPGEAFFYPAYFRLSFAASLADLQESIKRIKHYLNNI